MLRVKSLLSYAHRLGYATFNAGATIKVKSDTRNRGANLAKRIISEVDVALLVRGARTKRDRILLEVLYAAGLRVSELVALTWSDVLVLEEVKETLGHSNIATTSGYLHARPESSSGLKLDSGVFLR